jgi:hypothetical protein
MTSGDADEDDNRVLGIAISKIRFGLKNVTPAQIAISGFHPRAPADEADWTDGNAVINIPRHVSTISMKLAALPQGWTAPSGSIVLDI